MMYFFFFPLYFFYLLADGNSKFKRPLDLIPTKPGLHLHKAKVLNIKTY